MQRRGGFIAGEHPVQYSEQRSSAPGDTAGISRCATTLVLLRVSQQTSDDSSAVINVHSSVTSAGENFQIS